MGVAQKAGAGLKEKPIYRDRNRKNGCVENSCRNLIGYLHIIKPELPLDHRPVDGGGFPGRLLEMPVSPYPGMP